MIYGKSLDIFPTLINIGSSIVKVIILLFRFNISIIKYILNYI